MPVAKKSKNFWNDWGFVFAFLVVALAFLATQFTFIQDIISGWGFEMSPKMAEIETDLELTKTGRRILRATHPVVENDTADFNEHCYKDTAENVSVLGCYVNGNIYAYEITHEQLVDENNVTVAHELLHAAWERTDERDREKIKVWLNETYAANQDWFDEQLEAYQEDARIEEIYTRAGTRLADLPSELEEHYAKYFENRAKIVQYHQNYETPFKQLTAEIDAIREQIGAARTENDAKRTAYRQGIKELNERIYTFNNCANTAGCFTSDAQFQRQRKALDAEQTRLEAERVELNQQIDENNARIREYENLRASLGELNQAVDSRIEVEHNE